MENLLFLGLAAAVLFAAAGSLFPGRAQPPQIIYVQAPLTDQSGAGCLPLIILVAVILAAIILL